MERGLFHYFTVERPQRLEEQRRWEEVEKPYRLQQIAQSKAQWGTGEEGQTAYHFQKLELDKDILELARKQHLEAVKQFEANLGMRMTEDETKRLEQKFDLFATLVGSKDATPAMYKNFWNAAGIKDELGEMDFDTTVEDPNIIRGISESGRFAYEWKPGQKPRIMDFSGETSGSGSPPTMADLQKAMDMSLSGFGKKDLYDPAQNIDPETEFQEALTNHQHPKHRMAVETEPRVRQIKQWMDKLLGAETKSIPSDFMYQASPYGETRLGRTGQPIGGPPAGQAEWRKYYK